MWKNINLYLYLPQENRKYKYDKYNTRKNYRSSGVLAEAVHRLPLSFVVLYLSGEKSERQIWEIKQVSLQRPGHRYLGKVTGERSQLAASPPPPALWARALSRGRKMKKPRKEIFLQVEIFSTDLNFGRIWYHNLYEFLTIWIQGSIKC